jgi:hypothetical protein
LNDSSKIERQKPLYKALFLHARLLCFELENACLSQDAAEDWKKEDAKIAFFDGTQEIT